MSISEKGRVVVDCRRRIAGAGGQNKPVMQSLYVDLLEDPNAPPRLIHLGFQSGVDFLKTYLREVQSLAIIHLDLNLRFSQADKKQLLKRLADDLLPELSTKRMTTMPKTILITGSTDGIGLLTAKMLAAQGHTILLHGRNKAKLEIAVADVGGTTESYIADMSRMADVEAFASEILRKHVRLDVLINNAGVYKMPQTNTPEGLDVRFVVNTFAPYVLTRRLLPIIPADGRIVNLSSAAQAPVDVEAMAGHVALDDFAAYAQSKLAITIWSRELAWELPAGPVVVAVNPGSLLASKMVKEGFGVAGNDLKIGAEILCQAALDPTFADASGKYFDNDVKRFNEPNPAALDAEHCKAVMQEIHEVTAKLQ